MSGKIDWVALNPAPERSTIGIPVSHPDQFNADQPKAEQFRRDVTPFGREAERNHSRLSLYASELNALRRSKA